MSGTEGKAKRHILLFLRIAVVAAGIIWAASRIGQEQRWGSFVEYFRRMNIFIFAVTVAVFTLCHAMVGFRWWLLLRSQSIFIKFWAAVKLFFLGWFYNNFMPSSVGGDLVRAWYVTKHTDKRLEAVLSVFVDRVVGLLSTLSIGVFFYFIFLRHQGSGVIEFGGQGGFFETLQEYKWVFLWVVVAIAAVFCGLLLFKRGRAILAKAWGYIRIHGLKIIREFTSSILLYCTKPFVILMAFGLTVFVQILAIICFWYLGAGMGITVDIRYYFTFFTLAWVLGAVPVSIGGVVVVEGSLVILFTKFAGVDESAAWAIALSQRAVWMLTSLPGAVIHLIGAHLPNKGGDDKMTPETEDFFIDYEKSIN